MPAAADAMDEQELRLHEVPARLHVPYVATPSEQARNVLTESLESRCLLQVGNDRIRTPVLRRLPLILQKSLELAFRKQLPHRPRRSIRLSWRKVAASCHDLQMLLKLARVFQVIVALAICCQAAKTEWRKRIEAIRNPELDRIPPHQQ